MQDVELEAALARARRQDRVTNWVSSRAWKGLAVGAVTWTAVARPHTVLGLIVWCAVCVPAYLVFGYLGEKLSQLFDLIDARRRLHYTDETRDEGVDKEDEREGRNRAAAIERRP